jgi:hypothetical protein
VTTSTIEDVHPPNDVVTRFPKPGVMAMYHGNDSEPFIMGNFVNLDNAR